MILSAMISFSSMMENSASSCSMTPIFLRADAIYCFILGHDFTMNGEDWYKVLVKIEDEFRQY